MNYPLNWPLFWRPPAERKKTNNAANWLPDTYRDERRGGRDKNQEHREREREREREMLTYLLTSAYKSIAIR